MKYLQRVYLSSRKTSISRRYLALLNMYCFAIFLAEVTIGFRPDVYTVFESDGSVPLTVEVISGQLDRAVSVVFTTRQDTATSVYTFHLFTNIITMVSEQCTVPIIHLATLVHMVRCICRTIHCGTEFPLPVCR